MDDGGEWCTYVQAAKRLHKSHGAIRQMALRGQLQRVRGNDGKARVLVLPDMERAAHEQAEHAMDEQPGHTLHVQRTDGALVHALESHIKTLQAENEALKQDATTTRADLSAHVETLKAQLAAAEGKAYEHVVTLKADVERQEALLAAERERADKAITGFEALLRTESGRADRAIAAFESLAQQLEAMAAAKRPSWWRWLRGAAAQT
jgi:hypothetical protein